VAFRPRDRAASRARQQDCLAPARGEGYPTRHRRFSVERCGWFASLELAVAGGASERKLRRWHEEGLLAEPARYWIGKRRVTLYAPRDVERVQAVGELMARYHSVDRVALGLHALGYTPSEQRLRGAYDRFLTRQQEWFTPLDAILTVLRGAKHGDPRTSELDQAVAWVEGLIKSPRFKGARGVASIHESEDVPLPDATWEYLENVSGIFARGSLGSDEAVEGLLTAFSARMPPEAQALPNKKPIAEQVAAWKALQRATRVSMLRRVAAEASMDELTRGCDEVVSVVVGYLVMIDAAPYLGDPEPEWEPPVLCEFLNIDPSALAYFGLLAASFKRDPALGDELSEWLASWREFTDHFVRLVITKINGRVPALQVVAHRYLHNRAAQRSTPPQLFPSSRHC
jgi:DNA-binding transcriptional MerR regulator